MRTQRKICLGLANSESSKMNLQGAQTNLSMKQNSNASALANAAIIPSRWAQSSSKYWAYARN